MNSGTCISFSQIVMGEKEVNILRFIYLLEKVALSIQEVSIIVL